MNWKRSVFSTLLSAAMVLSFIPAAVFADDVPAAVSVADTPEVIAQEGGSVSVDSFDTDELLMQYIDQNVAEEIGADSASGSASVSGNRLSVAAAHKRRDVLGDVARNMYDALAPSVRAVAAGEREDTAFVVPASAIFDNARYDAEDLGIEGPIVEGTTITAEAFNAFKNKLVSDLIPPLSDMFNAMIADMPYELYWLDNEKGINFRFNEGWFLENMLIYPDGSIGIKTTNTGGDMTLEMTFSFIVSQDYSKGGDATHYGKPGTTEVDTNFTKAAAAVAKNISGIIERAKGKPDDEKLYQYKDDICRLASYHPTAMKIQDFPYGDPWQLIYVFDGDPNTKVVCEGYAKAFQYLCDNTSFNDSNVESRLVSGQMTGDTRGGVISGSHMWNIVHMDDGMNYIADITNCDDDSITDDSMGYPDEVFLRAPISGSVRDGYIFKYDDGTLKYKYEAKILRLFSEEELTLAFIDYPYGRGDGDNVDWDSDSNSDSNKGKAAFSKGVDTGDDNVLPVWIAIHLCALSLVVVNTARRRREGKTR